LTDKMTMGSLFDGVAMFPLAAELNGIKAVWASEIEKFPIAVSKHHFPDMKHLGDICGIGLCTYITHFSGTKCNFYINTDKDILVKPVDIITFGSPCQNLSVAGKRAGLAGEQSGLFSQAIRIIREMRFVTNGKYPRYAIWENVPGAFSSNKGQDFRTVLKEITAAEIPMPKSGKWANAGMVRGDGYSVAWRVCDAQYWGVAQRRKRIFLVTDFRGQRAGEILFECPCLPWNSQESGETREETAGSVGNGVETTSNELVLDDQGGQCINVGYGKSPTLRAETHGNLPCVLDQPITFRDTAGTLRANAGAPKHESDWEKLIVHPKVAGTQCSSGAGMNRPAGQGNETDLIFVIQSATMSGDKKQNGLGVSDGPCYTLDCRADHAVCYPEPANALLAKGNMSYRADVDNLVAHTVDVRNMCQNEELSGTPQSKNTGGYSLNYQNPVRVGYAVRRLMPIETERLMAMPDNWTNIPGASDTARYKAIGNSLVCNIADWIFSQIISINKMQDS